VARSKCGEEVHIALWYGKLTEKKYPTWET
jgi:hypothetical protein